MALVVFQVVHFPSNRVSLCWGDLSTACAFARQELREALDPHGPPEMRFGCEHFASLDPRGGYWDKMLAAWQGCGGLAEQPRACWLSRYQTFQPITSMSTARASCYTLWSQMLQKAAFTQRRRKKHLPTMRVFKFHLHMGSMFFWMLTWRLDQLEIAGANSHWQDGLIIGILYLQLAASELGPYQGMRVLALELNSGNDLPREFVSRWFCLKLFGVICILTLKRGSKQGLSSKPTSRARCLSRFQFTMGSGGSALSDATTQQVSETFASLSPEEQKKAEKTMYVYC